MAKSGVLKKQLKNQQSSELENKSKTAPKKTSQPKAQPEEEEEEEEIKPAKAIKTKAEKKTTKPEKKATKPEKKSKSEDDYASSTLSKKEQRKLKKLQSEIAEAEAEDESDKEDVEEKEDEDAEDTLDLEKLAASESESDINESEDDSDSDDDEEEEAEEEDEEEDEEPEDVPLSDAEIDSDADVVPHTKLTINNLAALRESLARVELPWTKHSFQEHQSVVSAENTEPQIKDIYDDTQRELAFYKQGLDAVKQARSTLLKLKVPFSRPVDYFAEMVKSDEHMDKLKNKLLTEAADKKASEDAKKQRHLKKFGKQVQNATLQERAKQKRDTLEKIKSLKKKRGANELSNEDDFQIALEEATREDGGDNKRRRPNSKRMAKDSKYGQGGMKRFKRKNDADSSADVGGFSNKKGAKGKPNRPGKSRRRH